MQGIFDDVMDWGKCEVPYHAGFEVCVEVLPDDLTPIDSGETKLTVPCGDWYTMMYDSVTAGRQFNKYRNSKTGDILWTAFREDAGMYGADKGGVMGSLPLVRTAKEVLIVLQHTLIDLGYDLGPAGADGICGSRTRAAIRAYTLDYGGLDVGLSFASIDWNLFDEAGLGLWHWTNFADCICQTNECMNVVPTTPAYPPKPTPMACLDFTPIPEPGPTPPGPTPPTPPTPPTAGKMSLWPMVLGGGIGVVGAMLYQDEYAPSSSKVGYLAGGGAMGVVGGLLVGLALPKQQMAGFYRSYHRKFPPLPRTW